MQKSLFIAEKPSVAKQFATALKTSFASKNGYMESEKYVITWCVGHLVTMSYPEKYDPLLSKWDFKTLPFLPKDFKYEVITSVSSQFNIVSNLLNRKDVDTIYVCTDSGREGEYIYRLVRQMAGVKDKNEKRVWIDSQTEEEILNGIKNAKPLSSYDNLASAAYLRAKEDYLMGINFSRAMTLKNGYALKKILSLESAVLSMGRVMTCTLGIIVKREHEIRNFKPLKFHKVIAHSTLAFDLEWKCSKTSIFDGYEKIYKDSGFLNLEDATSLTSSINLANENGLFAKISSISSKKEEVRPPLLYNLAELQNECSKLFKIQPDETLKIVQSLYEKKLTTYPRTDARVLSTAVAKQIEKNITPFKSSPLFSSFASHILENNLHHGIEKSKYCDDKKITDHYAIIPTGSGLNFLSSLSLIEQNVFELITKRFLSIFYESAVYKKIKLVATLTSKKSFENEKIEKTEGSEEFHASFKSLSDEGYLKVSSLSFTNKKTEETTIPKEVATLKKNDVIEISSLSIKDGETSPPKRYTSGSIILTMENAGQFIEDEDLRSQIKGSGIGTSATRAEIIKKLVNIKYIKINKKTQVITPTLFGESVCLATNISIPHLLSPSLTASWEKGLVGVSNGSIKEEEYIEKLYNFIHLRTNYIIQNNNSNLLYSQIEKIKTYYKGDE